MIELIIEGIAASSGVIGGLYVLKNKYIDNRFKDAPEIGSSNIENKLSWPNVFPFSASLQCPVCNCDNRHFTKKVGSKTVLDINTNNSRGCCGKINAFKKLICPNIPHFHIDCWACKLKYLMWSEGEEKLLYETIIKEDDPLVKKTNELEKKEEAQKKMFYNMLKKLAK